MDSVGSEKGDGGPCICSAALCDRKAVVLTRSVSTENERLDSLQSCLRF